MPSLDLSVVIGFRDWGVERLRRSVASLAGAMGDLHGEIIISDYGSSDPSLSRDIAESHDARWVSTPGDPVWSRSRALNAGMAVAEGALLVSTDADMLFAPGTLEAVHFEAMDGAPSAVFLQCRDLPEDLPVDALEVANGIRWADLERRSRLRPRWGMGGLMAIDRDGFSLLHGYDERLEIYGREDLDFALRARRAGRRTHWASAPEARMYHMWHPPTLQSMEETESGRLAMARNRRIVDSDKTTSRNLRSRGLLSDGRPLVSIIVTEVDDADDLHRTLATALAQSVRDTEVLVCGGSHVQTSSSLQDERLLWFTTPDGSSGELTAALNASRGSYVSIVRSGDLLPLDRTERLLSAVVEGCNGAVGSTAQFEADGAIVHLGDGSNLINSLVRREAVPALEFAARAYSDDSIVLDDPFRRAGIVLARVEMPTVLDPRPASPTGLNVRTLEEPATRPLRALLPAAHAGAEERTAVLNHLDGSTSEMDLDGAVERDEVTFQDSTVSGGVTVRGASYADLAKLSQLSGTLTVEPTAAIASGTISSWVSEVVDHALMNGRELPLVLRLDDAPETVVGGPDLYRLHSAGQVLAIAVGTYQTTSEQDAGPPLQRPWLLIGAEIEEVWT